MKDFNRHQKEGTEIRRLLDQRVEEKWMGRIRLKRGMKLYEYDVANDKVREVKIERRVAIGLNGKEKRTNKVHYKKDHLYTQALNYDNAVRHFVKMIAELMGLEKRPR